MFEMCFIVVLMLLCVVFCVLYIVLKFLMFNNCVNL